MTTQLRHQISYPAGIDAVGAMLDDVAFREAVCRAEGVLRHDVKAADVSRGLSMTIERVHSTAGLPAVAAKFVGSTITVVQHEIWTSAHDAEVTVELPDRPAEITGTIGLTESGGVTTETVSLAIRVSVPLLGGRLEAMVADLLEAALGVEQRVGREWLA